MNLFNVCTNVVIVGKINRSSSSSPSSSSSGCFRCFGAIGLQLLPGLACGQCSKPYSQPLL